MTIFNESTLRKLEQLTLTAANVRVGVMKGDRRSQKRGTSIEFADYRNYVKGDDLRRLDWNVYARLEKPFIKLLEEEEDLAVHLLVDASESMMWPEGEGDSQKLTYAARLTAALGHIALATGDLLSVTLLQQSDTRSWGPSRGQHHSLRLFQFLETAAQTSHGQIQLNEMLRDYALRGRRPGLLLLLSDLLAPTGYREGLNALLGRGYEVVVLHILSPDELEPPLLGDVKLVDSETGAEAEITLDATMLAEYQAHVQSWQLEIARDCQQRGAHYVPITTDQPWEVLVMNVLRQRGLVR
ncbi:MAG: DUF58 domain-containing protein [Chloroflexi bacterium]|nr:DUF58 domain-containing protein [Chloroflexota bacterium]